MKYVIAYLIPNPVKKYQNSLTKELATNFRIRDVKNNIMPHLTLKAPFITKNISAVEEVIKNFSSKTKKSKININGFVTTSKGLELHYSSVE